MWTPDLGCLSDRNPRAHPYGTRSCGEIVTEGMVRDGKVSKPANEFFNEFDDPTSRMWKDTQEVDTVKKNFALASLDYGEDIFVQATDEDATVHLFSIPRGCCVDHN